MRDFKPMLAGKAEDDKILFPVFASPKLDGVRAIVIGGKVMSRSLKEIPSAWVQSMFGGLPEGTDGELIAGNPTAKDVYRKTVSAVMSEDGGPVSFFAFDNFLAKGGFQSRYTSMTPLRGKVNVIMVEQTIIKSLADLLSYEEDALALGYEGVMIRSPEGKYKFGRSSTREGILLKVKRNLDSEAKIISVEAWEHNANEAKTNELGRTARSSHKENKVALEILGKLNVVGLAEPFEGIKFDIGTGFDGADDPNGERGQLWKVRKSLIGKIVKFKYFPVGVKDKPRHPVFLGFRDPKDM